MITTPDAFQSTTSGSDFYFIVLTDDAKELLYATFMGGTMSRTHVDGGTSRFDKNGIVYHSVCAGCLAFNGAEKPTSDFPTTPNAWSRTNNSFNCNNAAFKFDLSSLKARLRTNTVKRDMPGVQIICIPDPIIFENFSIGGEIFEWDLGDGTLISRMDTSFVSHQYKDPGKYLVKLKAIDQGTCTGMDETAILITVNVAQSFVQDDADVCFNKPYQLEAGGAASYSWTSDDGSFVSHEPAPYVSPRDTTSYYLTLTEPNGCVRKDTVTLNVVPGITPDFTWQKQSDCMARPEIAVHNLTDSLQGADVVFFDFGDGTTSDLRDEIHQYDEDGVYNIRLVTNREFCVWEKTVSLPVFEMFIPNVITPGLEGDNDVFTIRYGKSDGVTPNDYGFNVALKIFSRWGEVVFQTDHYQYDWSGQGLDAGVYYYEVSVEGHATCKSWIQLIK
ncbi:MAG TPA: PKD domain-containing protein, partial [Chryseosolibacter sp.]